MTFLRLHIRRWCVRKAKHTLHPPASPLIRSAVGAPPSLQERGPKSAPPKEPEKPDVIDLCTSDDEGEEPAPRGSARGGGGGLAAGRADAPQLASLAASALPPLLSAGVPLPPSVRPHDQPLLCAGVPFPPSVRPPPQQAAGAPLVAVCCPHRRCAMRTLKPPLAA